MSVKISLKEAMEMLQVGEVRAIERYYGKTFDGGEISGTDLTVAVVWAHERRKAFGDSTLKMPDWIDFDTWTLRQLNGYFEADEVEIDPEDPDTDSGKELSPAA